MHDDGTSGGPMRQVKVDNWGIFFLQRLQQFFNRSDHCDLTLQFAGNVRIKVHRLVLNACTEYFQALEKKVGRNKDNCLIMPSDLSPDVVLPIINFMYTGRLEFRDSLTKKLYYTAGRLNMPVLTKLLDAQGASDAASDPTVPTVSLTPKSGSPSIISKSLNSYSSAKKGIGKDLPETLPGRKLPIWKKRRTPFLMSSFDDSGPAESAALAPDGVTSIKEEPARPTRFEWPEDEDALKTYVPPFDSISYESAPLQQHTSKPLASTEKKITFEDLQSGYQPVKRQAAPLAESTPKKSKMMDIQSVKEYLQEQEVRKQIVSNEEDAEESLGEEGMALGDVEDEDDEDDDREAESILPDTDDMHESQDALSTQHQTKSILKQRYAEEATPGSKKVRFSFASTQEQAIVQQSFVQAEEFIESGETSTDGQASPANHAKIISEVLKKYPHLVRDNKNIRLRIMKQGSCPATETEAKNKKVSYVVLKAGDTSKNRSPAKVIVKTGGRVEHISSLVSQSQVTKPVSGAENTTGPWLCFSCGTNDDPINFESYYLYRKHLQEIHMEKIDARICEHCGHRASKRNLLLYHLYTKHNIPPPRNCQFPKCDQCEYVALSESLLIKHRNNHSNARDFVCKVCNASFKSNGALQGHMQTNLHSDPDKKKYACPYCQKPFVRNINLKAHIRSAHKDMARRFEEEEQESEAGMLVEEEEEEDLMFDPKRKKRRDILLLRGKDNTHTDGQSVSGNSQPLPLEPSSEAEALSNVASGIAASLGLADQLEVSEHQTVVQTMPGADGTVQTFIISAVPGQEYIVPEMLANAASGEQYQIATTSSLGDLVHYDASNLGSVVTSLAGVSGQQTIVITTAPSGGQEQLKLISADGSTLDQVTLLSGQNLLVTNADGTTSTASATEGYQAILQPNGVLTLQPVGTHVMQGDVHDGETVTEETLVQQGYIAADGSIITLTPSESVHKEIEQAMSMMPQEETESKPYELVSEHHLEVTPSQIDQEHVMSNNEVIENEPDLANQNVTTKTRLIGTSVPIQREILKSELMSTELTHGQMHEHVHENVMLESSHQVELSELGELHDETPSTLTDNSEMGNQVPDELLEAEEQRGEEEVEEPDMRVDTQVVEETEISHQIVPSESQQQSAGEEDMPMELEQVHMEQPDQLLEDTDESHLEMTTGVTESQEEEEEALGVQNIVQEEQNTALEVVEDTVGDMIEEQHEETEILLENSEIIEEEQYEQAEEHELLETGVHENHEEIKESDPQEELILQDSEDVALNDQEQSMEAQTEEEEGQLLIEGSGMMESGEMSLPSHKEDEQQGELLIGQEQVMGSDENQDTVTQEETALMIEEDQQDSSTMQIDEIPPTEV